MTATVLNFPRFVARSDGLGPFGHSYHWVYDPRRTPRLDNGEIEFSRLWKARQKKLPPSQRQSLLYEPWLLSLRGPYPLQPDFWAPNDGCFYEITYLDRVIRRREEMIANIEGDSPFAEKKLAALTSQLQEFEERWERKQQKVAEANELHGKVILLPYALWHPASQNTDRFDELVAA